MSVKGTKLAGIMYIVCMFASIGGGLIVDGLFGGTLPVSGFAVFSGVTLEMINALGLIVIASVFFVVLKNKMPVIAVSYFALRAVEVAFCMAIAFTPVMLYRFADTAAALIAVRTVFWDYVYAVIFSVSGFLFYLMIFKTGVVPKFIGLWGLIGVTGVFLSMIFPPAKMVFGALIIANELFLGVYLIAKGIKNINAI